MGDQIGEWQEEIAEERVFLSSIDDGSVEVGALIHKVLVQIFKNIFVQTMVEEKSGFGGDACPAPNPAAEAPQSLARGPAALTPNVPHPCLDNLDSPDALMASPHTSFFSSHDLTPDPRVLPLTQNARPSTPNVPHTHDS